MKQTKLILLASIFAFSLLGCEKTPSGQTPVNPGPEGGTTDKDTTEVVEPAVYAKGADISWLTQMEADGVKFYSYNGQDADCFEIM